ncbi:MAG: hypothetical protein AAGK37_08540 [Pseudomonadota bacterium]
MFAHTRPTRLSAPLPRPAARPWRWIDAAFATYRHRDRLKQLEPHMLRDIGLSKDAATEEAQRPFWDVPNWWR